MELREWALRILSADTLEEKLLNPLSLTDHAPGPPLRFNEPTRPAQMQFRPYRRKDKLPSSQEHVHPEKRAVCLHRFAGHELLAVEIMAQALLAFPEAPSSFRKGVAHTLREEQEHVRLYCKRMEGLGLTFGSLPLYRHFWNYVPYLTSPLHYVSVMSLTFEMANLDFAPHYGVSFARVGDVESAHLMQRIVEDEIGHVSFGWRWLQTLKTKESDAWDAWTTSLPPKMTPQTAQGPTFQEGYRQQAGIPLDWIRKLRPADLH